MEQAENKNGLGQEITFLIKENINNYIMYIALAVIFIVFQILSKGHFLTARNITNLFNQTGYIAVMALSMTLVLIITQIDLSVGFAAGFLGAVTARILTTGLNVWLVILITLIAGAVMGMLQGTIIGRIGVPAFITTLACQFIFRGFLTLVTESSGTIPVTNEAFIALSNGFLPEVFKIGSLHGLTLVLGLLAVVLIVYFQIKKRRKLVQYNFEIVSWPIFLAKLVFLAVLILIITIVLSAYNGLSWTMLIVLCATVIFSFVMNKTRIGRHIYGMGGNIEAASLSGVNVKRILIGVFTVMGCMAALGGILYTSRLSSATPTAGSGFELDTIASCYIGGVSTKGGIGKVTNSVVGAFVIMSLTNGLNLIGVGISYQYIIKGIIFIAAVAVDVRGRGSKGL